MKLVERDVLTEAEEELQHTARTGFPIREEFSDFNMGLLFSAKLDEAVATSIAAFKSR